MSHVEQLRTRSHRGKATAREPRGRGSTEAAEVRHAQTSSKPFSHTQAAEATTNHENDNEPRRTASITKKKMKPKVTRESDGAPTPRTKLNGSRSSKPVSYTHTDQELPANQQQAAPSTEVRTQEELSTCSARDTLRGRRVR